MPLYQDKFSHLIFKNDSKIILTEGTVSPTDAQWAPGSLRKLFIK